MICDYNHIVLDSMREISVDLDGSIDGEEFFKSISFVSPEIIYASKSKDSIRVGVSEEADPAEISNQLEELKKKYKLSDEYNSVFYEKKLDDHVYFDVQEKNENIIFFEKGQVGFGKKGKFLLDYFDGLFCKIATDMNAIEKVYPVLLPIKEYAHTGYIKKSPQYAIFCTSVKENMTDLEKTDSSVKRSKVIDVISEPEYALSPSACFHSYIEYQNQMLNENTLLTFRQNVFRNEGRFNYAEIGRLRDYQVREIVMIGDNKFVNDIRNDIMKKTCMILEKIELDGDISLASDSFVVPQMQVYKKIQKIDRSKYELHMSVSDSKKISTASFNLHGKAFTSSFNISVNGNTDTVTGCVGYGLHRWVIAFVSQYGWNIDNWPNLVKESYKKFM